jgi:hypothetical protein
MKGENLEICIFLLKILLILLKLKKEIKKKNPGKGVVRSQHWGSIEYKFH